MKSTLFILVMALCGCTREVYPFSREANYPFEYLGGGAYVLTDPASGCQYLAVQVGGITPRMNSDHQHICARKQ